MSEISVEQILESLSDDFQDLLVREAYIRKRRDVTASALAEKRQQQATLEETRPPFMALRGKGTREEFKSQAQRLREEIEALERVATHCDIILEKAGRVLEGELTDYFIANREEFRNAANAARLIPEWEAAIGILRSSVRQLVVALAVARSHAATGNGVQALSALDTAVTVAKALEAEVAVPNRLAKSFRDLLEGDGAGASARAIVPLPYLPWEAPTKEVTALTTMPLELADKRLGPMLVKWDAVYQQGLNALIDELARVGASQAAYHQAHVAAPLAQLRAMADGMVDDAHADDVYASMEARFVTLTG